MLGHDGREVTELLHGRWSWLASTSQNSTRVVPLSHNKDTSWSMETTLDSHACIGPQTITDLQLLRCLHFFLAEMISVLIYDWWTKCPGFFVRPLFFYILQGRKQTWGWGECDWLRFDEWTQLGHDWLERTFKWIHLHATRLKPNVFRILPARRRGCNMGKELQSKSGPQRKNTHGSKRRARVDTELRLRRSKHMGLKCTRHARIVEARKF